MSAEDAILEVHDGQRRQLQEIADTLTGAKKVVVITDAGISTNCGIPVRCLLTLSSSWRIRTDPLTQDFRSENGLYAQSRKYRLCDGIRWLVKDQVVD